MHIGGVGVGAFSHDAHCTASLLLAISLIIVQYNTRQEHGHLQNVKFVL